MRFILTLIVFLNISIFLEAQIYHFKTGKVIPSDSPGLFNTQDGVYNSYPAEYSVLLAFENRSKRSSRLISIPVIRIKAIDPDSCSYPIFLLHGGPGESNLKKDFLYDELLQYHDIVIVGYRGVDGQVKLDCPNIKQALLSLTLNENNSQNHFANALNDCVKKLALDGVDIEAYTIAEVVNDIYSVQNALGYDKISFLSFSFGTIVAQQFAYTYPKATENLVFIGPRPINNLEINGEVFNKQLIKLYFYYIDSLNNGICHETKILSDLQKRMKRVVGLSPAISRLGLVIFSFSQLYTTNEIEDFLEMAYGAVSIDSAIVQDAYNDFYAKYPGDVLLGDMYLKKQGQMTCDSEEAKDSIIGQLMARELNNWYSPPHNLLCRKDTLLLDTLSQKTLFICGELDVASPPELLNQIRPFFTNSQFIVLPKTGHLDFFFEKKASVDSLIFDFYGN